MLYHLLLNTLVIGSGYGLMAMAFRLMYSVSPFFNMTLGTIAVLGSYLAYWLLSLSVPLSITIALTLIITAIFSGFLEICIYTPMRRRHSSAMILMVASLGIYTMFEALILLICGPQYQNLQTVFPLKETNAIFLGITSVQLLTVIANLLIFIFLNYFLHHTFIGKEIRAINNSPTLADIIGLKNNQIIFTVSLLAGLILGLDGILLGFDTGMEPTMGFNLLFKGMIAAIIGGLASLRGAFLGALLLALAENLGVMLFSSEWRDPTAFVIFIMLLSLRPQGIFQSSVSVNR